MSTTKTDENPQPPLADATGSGSYTALRLAIKMDEIATWIKKLRPDWEPEKIAQEMREEIDRIEQEMMDGDF